ncbi:hypothetical protein QTP88_022236 [Uroleucon formosanum]
MKTYSWQTSSSGIKSRRAPLGSSDAPPKFITVPHGKYFYPSRAVGVVVAPSPVGFFEFIVDNCVNSTPPPPLSHANAVRYFRITADGLCKNNPWALKCQFSGKRTFVHVPQVCIQFVTDGSSNLYNVKFYCSCPSWIKILSPDVRANTWWVWLPPVGYILHITYVIFARQFHHKSSLVPFMGKTFGLYFFMSGMCDK